MYYPALLETLLPRPLEWSLGDHHALTNPAGILWWCINQHHRWFSSWTMWYSPFNSQVDWELAKWAKLHGLSATSFMELLDIGGVSVINKPLGFIISLPLSSCTNNLTCHTQVPMGWIKRSTHYQQCAPSSIKTRLQDGETFEIFHWNVLDCVAEIYGQHRLTPHLKFKPERHYANGDTTIWIYGDMHSGKWWWEVQVSANLRIQSLAHGSP